MKYLLKIIALSSYLMASPLQQMDTGSSAGQEQRDVKTKADFNDLVASLKSAIDMGQVKPYAYYLGAAYLTDFNVSDGIIEKDIKKAKYFFAMSLNDGNYAASYQLAMIELSKKNYDSALFVLDSTLFKLDRDKEQDPYKSELAKSFLATTFGTIVLEYKYKDKEAIGKAIRLLEGNTQKKDAPTILFILANLYNIDGQKEKANKLLTHSCSMKSGARDPRLDALCSQLLTRREK